MEVRNISVIIKSPTKTQPLGIYTTSFDAGRVGDSGTTRLTFLRPQQYEAVNLRLVFQSGYKDPIVVDLGQSNVFMLTSAQTQSTSFKLQVVFTDGSNGIIAQSNKLTFYLTSSVSSQTCKVDWVQELLQFAISEKVSMTRIVAEYPVSDEVISQVTNDDQDEDIEVTPEPTYYLKGFNHFGDLVMNVEIPFKEAYEYYKSTVSDVAADQVSYNNQLINPEGDTTKPTPLKATQVQEAIDELLQQIFNIEVPETDLSEIKEQISMLNKSIGIIDGQIETINTIDAAQNVEIEANKTETEKFGQDLVRISEDVTELEAKVKDLEDSSSQYELPPATSTTLGGIKVGKNLTITEDGTLSGNISEGGGYELLPATQESLGGVKIGNGVNISDDGTISVNEPTSYELPTASSTTLGGIKVGENLTIAEDGTLNAQAGGSTPYELPVATGSVLGGIKVGANLSITKDGELSGTPDTQYELPIASSTVLGGIKVGEGLNVLDDGTLSTQGGGSEYTLPVATSSTLGGVKIGSGVGVGADGTITVPDYSETINILQTTINQLQSELESQSQLISNLGNQITTLQLSIGDKLDLTGGTMTGTLIAGGTQDDNVAQVRNIIVYPAGTEVSSIPVPAQGTVVMIKEE